MSTSAKIARRLKRMKRGTPISNKQFYDLGTTAAVQKALSRLVQKGLIERVAKGMYARPMTLAGMPSVKVTASAEQIARKWAQRHGYTIVRQGVESAYRLGFQTQAPVKTVLWSNGSDKTFAVGNQVVEVRHVADSKLRWKSRPEGELLRSFSVVPASSVEASDLKRAFSRLSLTGTEIREAIRKLKAIALPEGWSAKLEELESALQNAL
ncbi:DUF6088 family protein [Allohahella marinimesophila]|uniref:Transcriptional regulator, AbiEi antitoxin, Type IV TA system n=1 Tax=Allohahella marinimesophila TaxID=1054972 RepID=A0ABP7PTG9_9GAMM